MKILILLFCTLLICSCHKVDDKEMLKSILQIDNLSDSGYQKIFIRNTFDTYPYTVFYKIPIDSIDYVKLKDNVIDNCKEYFTNSETKFNSKKVSWGYYHSFSNENIPEWFDVFNSEIDILTFYNVDSLKTVGCGDAANAEVFLKYQNDNCYVIVDVTHKVN